MFEAMFVGASLFEAEIWFLGGLLLGGIGVAVFIDSLLFRRRAEKKRARILGVIGKKQSKGGQAVYWPVYEQMGGCGFFGALILAASLQGLLGAHRRRAEGIGPRGGELP
jgi:hypothetical protein